MAGTMTTDDLYSVVQELVTTERTAALGRLVDLVADNREALGDVRNRFAARLHARSDDFEATAALSLLNRALSSVAIDDPLDWKRRWARGRKP